ncbi:MAG: thiamine phosphate synthase [Gemmatimonadota bacterium]
MRPLPRLHAITDAQVLALPDLGVRAAAIAAAGPAVALHARDHHAGGARLSQVATRFLALARPPEASVLVNGHPEIAMALAAHGAQLRPEDVSPSEARQVMPRGWIGSSVHSREAAETAAADGADFLMVGAIFSTPSHPESRPAGTQLIRECASLGLPVIAIGGITVERSREARDAGAYGVAAISGLWHSPDPAAAALSMLAPWLEAT